MNESSGSAPMRRDQIADLIRQGLSVRETAERCGVARQRVYQICKVLGLKPAKAGRQRTAEQISRDRLIAERHAQGLSTRQIAEEAGCHLNTVLDALKRQGVKISRGTNARYTLEQRREWRALRDQGYSFNQIAEETGASAMTILRSIRELERAEPQGQPPSAGMAGDGGVASVSDTPSMPGGRPRGWSSKRKKAESAPAQPEPKPEKKPEKKPEPGQPEQESIVSPAIAARVREPEAKQPESEPAVLPAVAVRPPVPPATDSLRKDSAAQDDLFPGGNRFLSHLLDRQREKGEHMLAVSSRIGQTLSFLTTASLRWIATNVQFSKDLPVWERGGEGEGSFAFGARSMEKPHLQMPDWREQLPLVRYIASRHQRKFPPILLAAWQGGGNAPRAEEWVEGRAARNSIPGVPLDSEGAYVELDCRQTNFYALNGQDTLMAILGLWNLLRTGGLDAKDKHGAPVEGDGITVHALVEGDGGSSAEDQILIKARMQSLLDESTGIEIIPAVLKDETYEDALSRLHGYVSI